ncbi:CBASS oligonucleotide cyclase CdnC-like [Babylonia areolata]|uniref:CBASS oligonucleotide cyclase CdnC-like n=1 Tax=Babylonia areolata TaxID=304850 RepID=UPI003FD60CD2
MAVFSEMKDWESLDDFHDRCVLPTREENARRGREIDRFVRFLQNHFNERPHTVARVVKNGSLGKDTVISGSGDIDLGVVFNGFLDIEHFSEQRETLLYDLDHVVQSYRPWRRDVRLVDSNRYLRSYTLHGQTIDVLPVLDYQKAYDDLQHVYWSMESHTEGREQAAQEFSGSLQPLQTKFVREQDEDVKRVMRLLKCWKEEKEVPIRSCTLELLAIHVDQRVCWDDTEDLFYNVMKRLANCRFQRVAFDHYYQSRQYVRGRRAPFVMDPANPYMDTLDGKRDKVNPNNISRKAKRTLSLL